MRAAPTVWRSLALVLARLAARILPLARAEWGEAMRAELEHIRQDREALLWALGCLRTGLGERLRGRRLLELRLIRWAMALWTIYLAQGGFCEAYLVLSYRFPQLKATRLFGYCTQAEDSLIPLFRATTSWEIAVCLLTSVLFLFATVALLQRARWTLGLFVAALTLDVALWLHQLGKPAFQQAVSFSDVAQDTLLYVASSLMAWILYRSARASNSTAAT